MQINEVAFESVTIYNQYRKQGSSSKGQKTKYHSDSGNQDEKNTMFTKLQQSGHLFKFNEADR